MVRLSIFSLLIACGGEVSSPLADAAPLPDVQAYDVSADAGVDAPDSADACAWFCPWAVRWAVNSCTRELGSCAQSLELCSQPFTCDAGLRP